MTPLIEARQLVLRAFPAAEPFDFAVHAGEHWLVVGAEGSGKSSFVKTLIGMLSPAAGDCRLFGTAIDTLSPRRLLAQRRELSVLFPADGLISAWSGFDNLALPLRFHGQASEDEIAARIEEQRQRYAFAAGWLSAPCATLTHEQRTLLALARALITRPKLLLIDSVPLDLVLAYAGQRGFTLLGDYLREGGSLLLCASDAAAELVPERQISASFRRAQLSAGRLQCSDTSPA